MPFYKEPPPSLPKDIVDLIKEIKELGERLNELEEELAKYV